MTLGATIGVTIGVGKFFTNLLIISFGVRGVTKMRPSVYARVREGRIIISNYQERLFLIVGTDYSNSSSLFSKTNDGHSFCNEQRFEDLKDFEPTSTTKTVCERFM